MPAVLMRWLFQPKILAVALFLLMAQLSGCEEAREDAPLAPVNYAEGILTLGDIDPDEPATRVRRLQPLADYLAQRLGSHGIGRGRVVIARNIEEMAEMMASGEVDLLFDSPFPVLAVNVAAGSKNFLLRHAKGDAEYWSVFITRKDSGLRKLSDLNGQVVVFQEPHSTSGFLLPAAMLIDQGFILQPTARSDSSVASTEVGCFFSGDEENTVELVFSGLAPAGVISNPDFRELPVQTRQQLLVIDRTESVPRQLVAVRPALDKDLANTLRNLLLAIDDADRARLAEQDAPYGWTWKFDSLSAPVAATLERLENKITVLTECGRRE